MSDRSFIKRAVRAFAEDRRLQITAIGFCMFIVVAGAFGLKAMDLPATAENQAAFWIGTASAFLEDTAFFLLIGVSALLFSLNHPEDEVVERRIRFYFNGRNVTAGAIDHIKKTMHTLGAYSPRSSYKLVYAEFNQDLNAIKVFVETDRVLANMFRDEEYTDEGLEYSVVTDLVRPPGGVEAELLFAYLSINEKQESLIDKPISITGQNLVRTVNIKIPPDGQATVSMKYWVWHKLGEAFTINPQKYTELFTFSIAKQCEQRISVQMPEIDGLTDLTHGSSCAHEFHHMVRGQRALFTLKGVEPVMNPGGGI